MSNRFGSWFLYPSPPPPSLLSHDRVPELIPACFPLFHLSLMYLRKLFLYCRHTRLYLFSRISFLYFYSSTETNWFFFLCSFLSHTFFFPFSFHPVSRRSRIHSRVDFKSNYRFYTLRESALELPAVVFVVVVLQLASFDLLYSLLLPFLAFFAIEWSKHVWLDAGIRSAGILQWKKLAEGEQLFPRQFDPISFLWTRLLYFLCNVGETASSGLHGIICWGTLSCFFLNYHWIEPVS